MRKVLGAILFISMIIDLTQPLFVRANQNVIENEIIVNDIRGIKYEYSESAKAVETENDFNYILENISLEIDNSNVKIETTLDEQDISLIVPLYKSQLGYNAENTFYGISLESDVKYRLLKFTIECNANEISLLKPNEEMAGNTVVTMAFYNTDNNNLYYFQFVCNSLEIPYLPDSDSDMVQYELANFAARPYEDVIREYDSLNYSFSTEADIEIDGGFLDSTYTILQQALDDIYIRSEESRAIDELVEACKSGPISLNTKGRSLVPDIPDSVYSSQVYGWEHENGEFVQEGSNAKRANGYTIYHMPDTTSGNVLNYVMRFEDVMNYNFSSQQFINSWIITHNIWVQYNKYQDTQYIFDDRAWNARIVVTGQSYVSTTTEDGYFTHFESSAVSNGSVIKNILRAVIDYVPLLGDAVSTFDTITSGLKLETGTLHPTERYAKKVTTEMDNLIKPEDHVTVLGVGSGINNVSGGYSYTCKTK